LPLPAALVLRQELLRSAMLPLLLTVPLKLLRLLWLLALTPLQMVD